VQYGRQTPFLRADISAAPNEASARTKRVTLAH